VSEGLKTELSGDTITLTLPRGQEFWRVALLVVGGLAVRLNLTLESLEDLQIAVESLLERTVRGEVVTLELSLHDGSIEALVGPVDGTAITAELEGEDAGGGVSLRRLLDTVADSFALVERDGTQWLSVEKRVLSEGHGAG
jgi:anti-sigma regulatory factor (Ser/Thr protein kinase)